MKKSIHYFIHQQKLIISHRSYRVCDGCGKHSPYANSYNEALDKAKEAGWIHYVDGNRDYCPECAKNIRDYEERPTSN
jgi:hypothetical protein